MAAESRTQEEMAEITQIAVLGAGTMGRGIAHISALAGYTTNLYDVDAEQLGAAERSIHRNLDKGVEIGKLEAEQAAGAKERLALENDLEPILCVGESDAQREADETEAVLKTQVETALANVPAESGGH